MRCLGPQKLAALLQPFIQRIEVRKGGHELPKPSCCRHAFGVMAGVAHILLNLTFLPARGRIAKLRLEDVVAGHRQEARVHIALFAPTNTVNSRLHIVIDAPAWNAAKDTEGMPMGIEQHPLPGSAFLQEMSRKGRVSATSRPAPETHGYVTV